MGTLEDTKDRAWTWVLSAPVTMVREKGVDFNPEKRSIKSVQGDAGKSSALEVNLLCLHAVFVGNLEGFVYIEQSNAQHLELTLVVMFLSSRVHENWSCKILP